MIRTFTRPIPLVLALAVCTFIPVMMAAVSVVQIPLGTLPEDSLRLASVPVAFFLHSLAGVLFGVLGPLQFARALRLRFGTLHRLTGRVFVLAGAGLALSGLALLLQVESIATGLLDAARGVALVMFPIYLITGEPPMGLATDIVVVGMWLLNIALGEWIVRRLAFPRPLQPFITVTQPVQRRGKAYEHRQGRQPQRWPR